LSEMMMMMMMMMMMIYSWVEWRINPEWCPYLAAGHSELDLCSIGWWMVQLRQNLFLR